jgi:hypothetical protein
VRTEPLNAKRLACNRNDWCTEMRNGWCAEMKARAVRRDWSAAAEPDMFADAIDTGVGPVRQARRE